MTGTPKHGFGSTFEILANRGEILLAHFQGAMAGPTDRNPYAKGTWGFEHWEHGRSSGARIERLCAAANKAPVSAGPIYRPPPEPKPEPKETVDQVIAKLDHMARTWVVKKGE